jgi:hypothetical protein
VIPAATSVDHVRPHSVVKTTWFKGGYFFIESTP